MHTYFMEQAYMLTTQYCVKRSVGALAVLDDTLLLHAVNTPLVREQDCLTRSTCPRGDATSGMDLESCWALHAEQQLLVNALNQGISLKNTSVYVTTQPCSTCTKLLVATGVKAIFFDEAYPQPFLQKLVQELQKKYNFTYERCSLQRGI